MKFIILTDKHNDNQIFINPDKIVSLKSVSDFLPNTTRTLINTLNGSYTVSETPQEIISLINHSGQTPIRRQDLSVDPLLCDDPDYFKSALQEQIIKLINQQEQS